MMRWLANAMNPGPKPDPECTARLRRSVRDDLLSDSATQAFASRTGAFASRMVCAAAPMRRT
ncbi:hypothetical protein ALO98_00851 [Pseudomonas syringae pv. tagetis]|nr:hypothetical protein ALO98_00851 [Pseudomonas syringae pv. tagetis]